MVIFSRLNWQSREMAGKGMKMPEKKLVIRYVRAFYKVDATFGTLRSKESGV